ncbi:MAG: hypothetical protein K0R18_587 [Bacillales bacterium]|jgi:uncharacterized protein YwgA|nr:hypothetical protein [Bacillales bacterium]
MGGGRRYMSTEYISVYFVHNHVMNRPPSTNTLSDRIVAQKVIYLANSLGVSCGDFEFNWYKKGPYSPALTRVLYDCHQIDQQLLNKYSLRADAKSSLNILKNIITKCPQDLTEDSWIELLASVHYLYEYNSSTQNITQKLINLKPQYNAHQVKYALNSLERNGFLH